MDFEMLSEGLSERMKNALLFRTCNLDSNSTASLVMCRFWKTMQVFGKHNVIRLQFVNHSEIT